MSSKLLIKGGTLLDPAKGLNEKGDLLAVDGVIEATGKPCLLYTSDAADE